MIAAFRNSVFIQSYCLGVERIGMFPANRNRNRFAEPTSLQIGTGIVCKLPNLRTGIGKAFVR